jgi:hypothetical protein
VGIGEEEGVGIGEEERADRDVDWGRKRPDSSGLMVCRFDGIFERNREVK